MVVALDGVELTVADGSFTTVLGPSGCGKTTLLRIIAGFDRPDAGGVRLGGRTLDGPGVHVAPEQRHVGIVPQDGSLFPHLSVGANVAFGLGGWRQRRQSESRERVAELLELLGLAGMDDRMPHELSGGQQQRVAVARALAPSPPLLLLDEPFSALDAALRTTVRTEVRDALRVLGTTVLLVTHDQSEALSLADSVVVMRSGRVAQQADPATLYRSPADLETARFVGDANVLPGKVDATSTTVASALGSLQVGTGAGSVGAGAAVSVLIRPEQVHLETAGSEGVLGQVMAVRFHGHDTLTEVRVGGSGAAVDLLVRQGTGPDDPALGRPGDQVWVTVHGPVTVFPD